MSSLPINPSITDALLAYRFLRHHIRQTAFEYSHSLSHLTGADVYLKLENHQRCGSFKIRGALYKMSMLSQEERQRGIVTCSSGNHGQGVAFAAAELGVKGVVFVPSVSPQTKQEAIKRYGKNWIELKVIEGDYDTAEREALRFAQKREMTFISAYEDEHVLAGASTVGLEMILEQPELDVVITPAGGGGLMNGVALSLCTLRPQIKIWGVQSSASNPYVVSWEEGVVKEVTYSETLADGLSGGIPQSLLSLAKTRMQGIVEVKESEIAEAIAFLHHNHREVVEGSGAIGVAALLSEKIEVKGKKVGVIISGGNIDADKLLKVLNAK